MFTKYFFLKNNLHNSNRTAVITENNIKISYSLLFKDIKNYSKYIHKNTILLILSDNSYNTLVVYLSCIYNKTLPIFLDKNIRSNKLEGIIKKFNPNYIWSSSNIKTLEAKYCKKNISEQSILFQSIYFYNHKLDPKIALLLSSSGSTGSFKFIKISYKNIKHNTKTISQYLKLDKNDKTIINLPFNYSYGLSLINTHLLVGGKILLTKNSILSKEFWNTFKNFKPTNFNGVPYTYELIAKLYLNKIDFSCLKFITQAGGKLNKDLIKKLIITSRKYNFKFYMMYGQTEASPRISYLNPNLIEEKIGSIGKPIKGGKIWLEDENNNIIKRPYREGELIYKGPNVFMGYAKNIKDLDTKYINSNILRTGDIAEYDSDKFYFIKGRKNRYSKIYGNRINLEEIENIFLKYKYPIVCSIKDNYLNIYCEKYINSKDLLNMLKKNTTIPINRCRVHIIKKIPRNNSGKVIYNKLDANNVGQ